MPAKSKAQQRFFGMVDAYKKGEMPNASKAIKDAADSMSAKEIKRFAKTKLKGLPNHVKKHNIKESADEYRQEIEELVNSCVFSWSDLMNNPRNGDVKDTVIYLANKYGVDSQTVFNDLRNAFNRRDGGMLEESSAGDLRRVQKKIYNLVNRQFGGVYSDMGWNTVFDLIDAVRQFPEVDDVYVSNGVYYNYLTTAKKDVAPYRDYNWVVKTAYGYLNGYIRCCAAGTVEDPFLRYDIVISLYPAKEDDLHINEDWNHTAPMEEKVKINENDIKYMVNEVFNKLINYKKWYVLWDGTTTHTVQGVDVEDEMEEYDIDESDIHGPFMSEYDADLFAAHTFDEAYGTNMEGRMDESEVKCNQYYDKELNFTHFAVNKTTNKIVNGWNYNGYDSGDLASDKNYYFFDDLRDYELNPKNYSILSFGACIKRGVDPNNREYWSNQ